MIGFRYWIWPMMALGLAIALFQIKQSAQRMDKELRSINAQILNHRQEIMVLEAEWSLHNQTAYLAGLSERYLGYRPEDRATLVQWRDIPMRPKTDLPLSRSSPLRSQTQEDGIATLLQATEGGG